MASSGAADVASMGCSYWRTDLMAAPRARPPQVGGRSKGCKSRA